MQVGECFSWLMGDAVLTMVSSILAQISYVQRTVFYCS
jgi:hypothetical protein